MGKPGRDRAPGPVKPGDSATRQEVRHDGPPTRFRWGGYHLARPVGPQGAEKRLVPETSNLKPQTTCLHHIQGTLNFDDIVGRSWGLDMNLAKNEVHAMGTAPQRSFSTSTGPSLLTINKETGLPHTVYKY